MEWNHVVKWNETKQYDDNDCDDCDDYDNGGDGDVYVINCKTKLFST